MVEEYAIFGVLFVIFWFVGNLLLEVDHIIPISKGGKTEPDNLQTLCWKCNRTKSNKIISQKQPSLFSFKEFGRVILWLEIA